MNHFEFYKELYFKENERRQEVLNSLNIPIAIITALSSASYLFITSFDYRIEVFLSAIFIGMISITSICLLFAIYFLIRAFSDFTKGYEYSGIPYTNELYDWNKKLERHFEEYENDKELANEHYTVFITENLVKHTEHNMYVNDKKHGYIYRSKKFLIIALILTLITLIPFGYSHFNKDVTVHKVELMEERGVLESNSYKLDEKLNRLIDFFNINNNGRQKQGCKEADSTTTTTTK